MLLALTQNDASLLRCRLHALKPLVRFPLEAPPDAIGAGFVQGGHALVRRRPGSVPGLTDDPISLVDDVTASGVIVHTRRATVGIFKDENTHPFRYGRWLFAHDGTLSHFGDLRPALLASLPPFLRRSITGETDSEHLFALFLSELKSLGVLESHEVPPGLAGEAMVRTLRTTAELLAEVGGVDGSTLNLVATNGRNLVAARRGDRPLYVAALGGLDHCELCDLPADAPETHPQRLPHQNLRAVAVATALAEGALDEDGGPFRAMDDGEVISVDRGLEIHRSSVA